MRVRVPSALPMGRIDMGYLFVTKRGRVRIPEEYLGVL